MNTAASQILSFALSVPVGANTTAVDNFNTISYTVQENINTIIPLHTKTYKNMCFPTDANYSLEDLDLQKDLYINFDGKVYDLTEYQKKVLRPVSEIMGDEKYSRFILIISIIEHMGYSENYTDENINREIHHVLKNMSTNYMKYIDCTSNAGAKGPFQITPPTKETIKNNYPINENLEAFHHVLDKKYNFKKDDHQVLEDALIAANYMKFSEKNGAKNTADIVASYNAGIGVLQQQKKKKELYNGTTPPKEDNGIPEETENYVDKYEIIKEILIQNIEERKSKNDLAFKIMLASLQAKETRKDKS